MKKVGYYIALASFALLWLYVLNYGLIQGHFISLILCVIILAPVTFRVVYGYLLSRSAEKEEQRIAESLDVPLQEIDTPAMTKYCPACGAKIEGTGKFCTSCGRNLESANL